MSKILICWPCIPLDGDQPFCLGRNEIHCWRQDEVPEHPLLHQPGVLLLHGCYCDVLLALHVFLVKECHTRKEAAQSSDEDHGAAGHCILVSSL